MNDQPKYFLSKAGKSRLEQELAELRRLKTFKTRGESPRIFHSEDINPEFLAYQEDLELLETRLAELEIILKNSELISPPTKEKQDRVVLGARVVVEVGGEEDELEIVGTLEANPSLGKISNECPVGRSLLGHKVGEEVVIGSAPKVVYKIKKVSYQK